MKYLLFAVSLLCLSCNRVTTVAEVKSKVVGILPYKGVSRQQTATISKAVADFYQIKTKLLPEKELPKSAFVNIKSARYRADSIIRFQNRTIPNDVNYVLGITTKDVSITKYNPDGSIKNPTWKYNDFGVMGLAYCPERAASFQHSGLKARTSHSKWNASKNW